MDRREPGYPGSIIRKRNTGRSWPKPQQAHVTTLIDLTAFSKGQRHAWTDYPNNATLTRSWPRMHEQSGSFGHETNRTMRIQLTRLSQGMNPKRDDEARPAPVGDGPALPASFLSFWNSAMLHGSISQRLVKTTTGAVMDPVIPFPRPFSRRRPTARASLRQNPMQWPAHSKQTTLETMKADRSGMWGNTTTIILKIAPLNLQLMLDYS